MKIIGIAGPSGAGKTELTKLITGLWHESVSVTISTIIREELVELGVEQTEQTIRNHVVGRRREIHPEYWSRKLIDRARESGIKHLVVDGIRTPADAIRFKDHGAVLIGINAPPDLRLERLRERAREGWPRSDDELRQCIQDDWKSGGEYGWDVGACLSMCRDLFDGRHSVEANRHKAFFWLDKHKYEMRDEVVRDFLRSQPTAYPLTKPGT